MKLFDLIADFGLEPETLNFVGIYYLNKIKDYKNKLVLLKKGKKSSVYRPNVNLFIELKLERFTESDYQDCIEFIKYAKRIKKTEYKKNIDNILNKKIKKCTNEAKKKRYKKLAQYLPNH
ncbi:MAG: hypothetical protein ABIA04_01280 [Pseudomonadota bacterium]